MTKEHARRIALALGFAAFVIVPFQACNLGEPGTQGVIQGRWQAVEAIRHTFDHQNNVWKTETFGYPSWYLQNDWILEIHEDEAIYYQYQGGTGSKIDTTPWNAQVLPDGRWVDKNLDTVTFRLTRDGLLMTQRVHGTDPLAERLDWRLTRYTGPFLPPDWVVRPDSNEYIKHRLWKPVLLVRSHYDFDNSVWKVDSSGVNPPFTATQRITKVLEDRIVDYQYVSGSTPRIDTIVWGTRRIGIARWVDNDIDTLIMGFRGDSMTLTQLPLTEDPTRSRYDWVFLKYTGAFLPDDWVVGDPAPPPTDTTTTP